LDPNSWVSYFKLIGSVLTNRQKYSLTKTQIEQAWKYAYIFYFVYPRPFPWHLWSNAKCYESYPLKYIFSREGQEKYGKTFEYLSGTKLDWNEVED